MDARAHLMIAALGFVRLEGSLMPSALVALHRWLDSWAGIGAIEHGMARHDLSLTRYANEGWRATFYVARRAGCGVGGVEQGRCGASVNTLTRPMEDP